MFFNALYLCQATEIIEVSYLKYWQGRETVEKVYSARQWLNTHVHSSRYDRVFVKLGP